MTQVLTKTAEDRRHEPLTPQDAHDIGVEAYVYLYSLVTMDITRLQSTNVEPDQVPFRGPMNTFVHVREFPPADFKMVVRPNFDTLYSVAWLDLTSEPMIITAADTGGRYYLLPMLDMWSDVFASPGARTSGTEEASFAIVPPGWRGELPKEVQRIDAPTPYVWVIGRTQTNGPKDYDAVHQVQDGYRTFPLSSWGKEPQTKPSKVDPSVDMKTPPLDLVNGMTIDRYFAYGAELMKLHPPHATDWSIVTRMARIGLTPGSSFRFEELSSDVRKALETVPADAQKLMLDKLPTIAHVANGWSMNTDTMGVYGDYYLKRAIIAMAGLGANQPEDAVYPMCVADASGQPVNGDHDYVLHFGADELPPANAFWSVTMYDEQGFQVANPLSRFAIGDRDELAYNPDGSLDLYLQHEKPGADKESNWLPAPRGPLGVTMRLYAPKASVLEGAWAPPAIQRV
jgi:hypothetical protein